MVEQELKTIFVEVITIGLEEEEEVLLIHKLAMPLLELVE
jgi:hypothetical protein